MDSSAAERLLSRRTRSLLPLASQLLQPKVVPDVAQKLQTGKHKQAVYYDRGSKEITTVRRCGTSFAFAWSVLMV